jgi:hypothetical protein
MIDEDRAELQAAALICRGGRRYRLSYYSPGWHRRMAQNSYLGAYWCSRRQRNGLLPSGFSFVNGMACTDELLLR